MVELPIQLGTIRIRVPCYISNHENDYNIILGGTLLNNLDQYNIQKEGIQITLGNETCFISKI